MSKPQPTYSPNAAVDKRIQDLSHSEFKSFPSPTTKISISSPTPSLSSAMSSGQITTDSSLTQDPMKSLLPRDQKDIDETNFFKQLSLVGGSETLRICKLALPISLTGLMELLFGFTNVFALGHLGTTELAAGTLGSTFVLVTGYSVSMGLNTAFDTLGSQAYSAASNPQALGILLQRCLFVNLLLAIPVSITWIFAKYLLIAAQQMPDLAEMAAQYCWVCLPSVLLFPIMDALRRFFSVQGNIKPPTVVFIIALPFHVLLNYLLILYPATSIGFLGAPLANNITYLLIDIVLIAYIKLYLNNSWGGWSMQGLKQIPQFFKLGIPGVIMICADWWAWNIVTILSGTIGETTLAAQSIVYSTYLVFFQIPLGIGMGANARVGNLLGSGCANMARMSSFLTLIIGAACTGIPALALFFTRHWVGYLFTPDLVVIEKTAEAFSVVALLVFLDGFPTITMGILRGCGLQKIGAIMMLIFYYLVGLPSGSLFAFHFDMGLQGLYLGICVCLVLMGIAGNVLLARMNWKQQVEQCKLRIQHAVMSHPEV